MFDIRLIISIGVLACCGQALDAQDGAIDAARKGAVKTLTKIGTIGSIKLTANVRADNFDSDVVVEVQGDSIWITGESRSGTTNAQKRESQKLLKEVSNLMGSGGKFVHGYHDGKTYNFNPGTLQLLIAKGASVKAATHILSLLPSHWYGFHQYEHEVLRFPSLLDNPATKGEVIDKSKVRFRNDESSEGFALREIEVDSDHGFAISRYLMRGGALGTCTGDFVWTKVDDSDVWYPKQGKQMLNDHLYAEWTIEKISLDARDVRESFDFEESEFPFGTLIRDTSESEREEHRYIGGDTGKKEFELRRAAAQNSRLKELP